MVSDLTIEQRQSKRIFHLEAALLRIGTWPSLWCLIDIKKYAMEQLRSGYTVGSDEK